MKAGEVAMSWRNSETGWGWPARLLHWVMAALILFQLGLGLYMSRLVQDLIAEFNLTQLHKSWGFVIFVLALARVAWRLFDRATPRDPEDMPRWQVVGARISHRLLYGLILLLPLSGWVMSAASPNQDLLKNQNMVFGAFAMPDPWVPGVKAVAEAAERVHTLAAILLALVLVVHVGAALQHHFVKRDPVLTRMILGR